MADADDSEVVVECLPVVGSLFIWLDDFQLPRIMDSGNRYTTFTRLAWQVRRRQRLPTALAPKCCFVVIPSSTP